MQLPRQDDFCQKKKHDLLKQACDLQPNAGILPVSGLNVQKKTIT